MLSRSCGTKLLFCLSALCFFNQLGEIAYAQEVTRQERNAVKAIAGVIDRAGRQYRSKKYESSAEYFAKAAEMIDTLAGSASPDLMEMIKPEHARLTKAYELLKEEGQNVSEVKPLPEPMMANGEAVSFKTSVVPILVAKCGRCHINRTRGQFSAATYERLMQSGHVDAGMPNVSRLIEVIEDGDMPPGGSLLDEELKALKVWIKQGANSDIDAGQNLAQVASASGSGNAQPERLQVKLPTGGETISFSKDIAPILIENCAGCHVDPANNARANLNMTTFRQLLRGGDSGPILVPGAGTESLLVKKLLGTGGGMRMPQGRPALNDKTIKLITKWINEGASFDGIEPALSVRTIAARAKASGMTHNELAAQRKKLAAGNWQTVMANTGAKSSQTADLFVLGSIDQDQIDAVAKMAQALVPKIKAAVKGDRTQPLVKGKISVYVFSRRYDFGEFGLMVEGREIPKQLKSRWRFDTIDAYVVALMTRNESVDDLEVTLARQLGSTYIASLAPDVPRWFADGMGYWIAAKVLPRADEIDVWESEAEEAAMGMSKPDDFMRGQLADDQSALVSYYFVSKLRSGNAGKFNQLLGLLNQGQSFSKSFTAIYGMSPIEFVGGKKPARR